MNKEYCRDVDVSPGYYNTGKVREITNTMVGHSFNLKFAYNLDPVTLFDLV